MADEAIAGGLAVEGQPPADGADDSIIVEQRPTAARLKDLATPKKDHSVNKVEDIPDFKPRLMTPATTRTRVTSSGYGSPNYVPKVVKEKAPAVERVPDEEELTFKPNMKVTKKVRAKVTSSAYGQTVAAKKDFSDKAEKPSFKPDMTKTERTRKTATSTGYGKALVNKKTVDPKKYDPDFKPKMDFGKAQGKLRISTEARFLAERQRPKTAPEKSDAPKSPLLFTLAADPGRAAKAESTFVGPEFVLDGAALASTPVLHSKSFIDKAPPPLKPTRPGQKLKESATSTGYGSTYKPPQGERAQPKTEPQLKLGKAGSTWIEDPDQLPVVSNPATKNAQATYTAGTYRPETVKREIQPAEPSSAIYIPTPKDSIPSLEETAMPKRKTLHVASSGYGKVGTAAYDGRPATAPEVRANVAAAAGNADGDAPNGDEQTTIL
eukprot:CAMPEP_0182926852 /NCGR_PEP_ID=MMETSP0105_2-20130417/12412_1 /TAXON_ID=81532 ORGANISM="Acanthoeca-like sp., Strain 10tr" /NCGR_SAMPLE_ID=MMETSP0105_2 /ASSEMBLY_ACC=CAM_ASM_000205 /LENGTH=436 /DNA_ID=CAMNT_0025064765 /DNA_START=32 /DNA_END=1342 /DNA_ORIENTATION=+